MFLTEKYFSLEGKTAIVTGGSTGLGLAITKCMVGAGAKVIALSRGSNKSEQDALKEFGSRVAFYKFDVTDTEHTQYLVDQIIKIHGPITILVNNAGNHCKKYIEEMTVSDYTDVLNVHLVGAFALTKALFPHMKEQGAEVLFFRPA